MRRLLFDQGVDADEVTDVDAVEEDTAEETVGNE